MMIIVISGGRGLEFFLKVFMKSFFFDSAVSARRLSALIWLRNFCLVANLKFKCVAWQVKLDLLFDQNRF